MMTAKEKRLAVMLAEKKLRDLCYDLEKKLRLRECDCNWHKKYGTSSEAESFFSKLDFVLSDLTLWIESLDIDEYYESTKEAM